LNIDTTNISVDEGVQIVLNYLASNAEWKTKINFYYLSLRMIWGYEKL
jgi:hypothetical protein